MLLKLALIFSVSTVLITVPQAEGATDKLVCYFASWAGYRNGEGTFKPTDINPNLCTHLLYAFLGVETDGSLKILDPWNEVDLHCLENVAQLKAANPKLKLLVSIGGWNAGNAILHGVAASPRLRATLIQSCLEFFETWGYDGIDVNWEYPVNSDKANFVKLLQEMRTAFDAEGYFLSVTVSAKPLSSYDIPQISKVADVVNIMTYDYYTTADGTTGHNSPLYGPHSVNDSVHSWLKGGAPASLLTIGVPFYGHSFSLTNENKPTPGAAATPGVAGPFTQTPGLLGYNEICAYYHDDFKNVWDDEAQVPYSYDGFNWISYDDEHSVTLKAQYAKNLGLAGVSVWSIDTDDFLGACGTPNILLQAIKDNID